jgi:hypothetical protein
MTAAATNANSNQRRRTPHIHAVRSLELAGLCRASVAAPNEIDGRKWLSARDDEGAPDLYLEPATRSAWPPSL